MGCEVVLRGGWDGFSIVRGFLFDDFKEDSRKRGLVLG